MLFIMTVFRHIICFCILLTARYQTFIWSVKNNCNIISQWRASNSQIFLFIHLLTFCVIINLVGKEIDIKTRTNFCFLFSSKIWFWDFGDLVKLLQIKSMFWLINQRIKTLLQQERLGFARIKHGLKYQKKQLILKRFDLQSLILFYRDFLLKSKLKMIWITNHLHWLLSSFQSIVI